MKNFFTTSKPLESKPIPHSGPSEPQPDAEPETEPTESTDSEEESSES